MQEGYHKEDDRDDHNSVGKDAIGGLDTGHRDLLFDMRHKARENGPPKHSPYANREHGDHEGEVGAEPLLGKIESGKAGQVQKQNTGVDNRTAKGGKEVADARGFFDLAVQLQIGRTLVHIQPKGKEDDATEDLGQGMILLNKADHNTYAEVSNGSVDEVACHGAGTREQSGSPTPLQGSPYT